MSDTPLLFQQTILVGAGGTGGILAAPLARLIAHHPRAGKKITIIDGDSFEPHNIERQFMAPDNVGQPKCDVLREHLELQGLPVGAISEYLTKPRLRMLLRTSGTALVVMAVDNDATRAMSLEVIEELNEGFWISPGNSDTSDAETDVAGSVLWWSPGSFGADPRDSFDNLAKPADYAPRPGSCANETPSTPQLLAANALAAALTLTTIANALDGRLPADFSTAWFNGRTYRFSVS